MNNRLLNTCLRRIFATTVLAFGLLGPALAASPINTLEKSGLFGRFNPGEIAIRGYDTVAYFTQGQPVAGSADHTVQWQGATWQFASAEHRDLFQANPEQYAPQYGGYCAFGVAGGYLVKIEPENWTIVDDKLYLNYDDKVQNQWNEDIPGFISRADAKFEDLLASD